MAGIGAPPKDARRRRNAPARGEWTDLQPVERRVLPQLPENAGEDDGVPIPWRDRTRQVWDAWAIDPVSLQWTPSEIEFALDTIALHNRGYVSDLPELRRRQDTLGLTPKGKRDLRWRTPMQLDAEAGRPVTPMGVSAVSDYADELAKS